MRSVLNCIALILALCAVYLIAITLALYAEARIYGPPQQAPLIRADYSRCVVVRNGPLIAPKPGIRGLHNHPEIT